MTYRSVRAWMSAFTVACGALLHTQDGTPRFEVSSIKKTEWSSATGVFSSGVLMAPATSAGELIQLAYRVDTRLQIVGAPSWLYTEFFAVTAKGEDGASEDAMRRMVQSLLEDRFRLDAHWEQRPVPHLDLLRAKESGPFGPNLQLLERAQDCSSEAVRARRAKPPVVVTGQTAGGCGSPNPLIASLMRLTGQLVINRTDIKFLDFMLFLPNAPPAVFSATPDVATLPSPGELSEAVTAQLGLKLEPTRAPIDVLVITSISEPAPN